MKYESEMAMRQQHFEDALDTMGNDYNDVVNAVFGVLLTAMVVGRNSDLNAVIVDIKGICDHYVARCEAIKKADISPDRVLN